MSNLVDVEKVMAEVVEVSEAAVIVEGSEAVGIEVYMEMLEKL